MFVKMQPFCNSQQSTGHDPPPPIATEAVCMQHCQEDLCFCMVLGGEELWVATA